MRMTRRILIQLTILAVISCTAIAVMVFNYMRLPAVALGVGQYTVTLQLPEAGGLYQRANVTYRGIEVGEVKNVRLTGPGVDATLLLNSDVKIPSDLRAEVHSTTALGEQYVALLPQSEDAPPLANGDVITADNTSVPPDINALLDATNSGLEAIPGDNLQTAIDESYRAVGGLGPELHRLVEGTTALAIDADKTLPELLNVIDNVAPVLDSQSETADSVRAWASHLADVTGQLQDHDGEVRSVITSGGPAAEEVRGLFAQLQPTVPILAANLASIAPVLVTYRADLEQVLVLAPYAVSVIQGINIANRGTKQAYQGAYMNFNLNINLPPVCTTGFLPPQQQRVAAMEDWPDRPSDNLYCRIPQDSPFHTRGARNTPCETRPGKRAATVKECESDEQYVPLNDGLNWKGDPNATLSGQDVPQAPPVAVAEYDPASGTYLGPDGQLHRQNVDGAAGPRPWQSMLIPPGG